jgi:hypothetical protein
MQIYQCETFRNQLRRAHPQQRAVPLTAEFVDAHRCEALGHIAIGHAPALALCRHLLAAGLDPDRALHVYRNGVLSLRLRSIREGARLTVKDGKLGTPKFRLASPTGGATASLMRGKGRGVP